MPVAPVDANGTVLYYSDSGVVPGSPDYTTLVIYHGSAFSGHIFDRLLPLAKDSNVRLILLNRRDYVNSTKYTDDDLADLNGGNKIFMETRALEEGYLLSWIIDEFKIPKTSEDGKSGGLAVMGWSLGNSTSTSILGHPDAVSKDTYSKLAPYWRKLIVYDPPHLAFGIYQPTEPYNPFGDPECTTPAEIFENFRVWVGGYYHHDAGLAHSDVMQCDMRKRGDWTSVDKFTPDESARNFDPVAGGRTEWPMFFPMQPVLKEQTAKAFFVEKYAQEVLPGLKVEWILCENTVWFCPWAKFEFKKMYDEAIAAGKRLRPISFTTMPGNHFIHWDEPESCWPHFIQALQN